MKDRIKGMMMGVAIGDALGQPHENQPALGYPVKSYPPTGGQTTDDWQMTAAMARALMKGDGFDMNFMVAEHVAAYDEGTRGWGGAHRNACAMLKQGVSPRETGKLALDTAKPYRGRGNGMCMKITPLAALHFVKNVPLAHRLQPLGDLAMMTHATGMGLSSAAAMEEAVIYCLKQTPSTFDPDGFLTAVQQTAKLAEGWVQNEPDGPADRLSERLTHLLENWRKMSPEDVSETYKGGGYVYESLPFALAFFCMGRHGPDCVYDCVGSGGDTDTNGSMVAALVGALHGEEIFSKSLLYKLIGFPDIDHLSEQFAAWCDKIDTGINVS